MIDLEFQERSDAFEKIIDDVQQKYENLTLDEEKRGACIWNSKYINGTLKKRWPDVIGIGFAKVSFFITILAPTLTAWPLRDHEALKSFF